MTRVSFKQATKAPLYYTIRNAMVDALHHNGHISYLEALKRADFAVLDVNSIHWHYIRRMIEEAHDTQLYLVNAAYFRRHEKSDEMNFPARYIAHGRGRKAAGFVIASLENGHFVRQRLDLQKRMAEGHLKSANKTLKIGQRVGAVPQPMEISHSETIDIPTQQ